MWKTEDAISELMLSESNIHSVGKNQMKTLIKKTTEKIKNLLKRVMKKTEDNKGAN